VCAEIGATNGPLSSVAGLHARIAIVRQERLRRFCLASFMTFSCVVGSAACGQEPTREQRQPLELVFAGSIVPQGRHAGVPIGITSSTARLTALVKFTFEMGADGD